jgi:ParB-like chromosome segregation protein Spo0J
MQIESLAIGSLRSYARNARTHSKKQIGQIAKSIKRFGFCNPVLVDDQRQIIAGHGRVAAAKLLGIEHVPTVKLTHLSEVEKRAYILADNRGLGPRNPGDRAADAGDPEFRGRADGLRDETPIYVTGRS